MNEDDDERSLIDDAKEDVQDKKQSSLENLSKMQKVLSKPNGAQKKIIAKAIASLGPIIPYVIAAAIIILIIIIVIGIIGFFLNMPGMMSGKIKQIFSKVATSIKCIYETDADATTSDEDVLELADYIHSMDYDLIGYGFVQPDPFDDTQTVEYLEEQGYERVVEDIPVDEQEENGPTYKVFLYKDKDSKEDKQQYTGSFYDADGQKYNSDGLPEKYDSSSGDYTKYGITYDENGKVKDINDESSILRTYAVSNRRIYVIRNDDDIFYYKFAIYMNKLLNGYQGAWAQGLLELWTATDGVADKKFGLFEEIGATKGWKDIVTNFILPWNGVFNMITRSTKITITENNQLSIKVGWGTNPMLFELDGWTGRYGLSQDFLISLHLATMSPDLVTTMVQTFDTRAQIYLDYIDDAQVDAYFHTPEMQDGDGDIYVKYTDLDSMKTTHSLVPFDSWYLNRKEAKEIMEKYKIESLTSGVYTCGGQDPSEVYWYSGHGGAKADGTKCLTEIASNELDYYDNVFEDSEITKKGSWENCITFMKEEVFSNDEIEEATEKAKADEKSLLLVETSVGKDTYFYQNGNTIKLEKLSKHIKKEYQGDEQDKYGVIDMLRSYYNQIKENKEEFNIVIDDNPEKCPISIRTFFDPDSEGYIGNYLDWNDFVSFAKATDAYYEIPIAVWGTNDDNLKEGDEGYDPDADGEFVLSLLIRRTSVDGNYDMAAIGYKNLSYNKASEMSLSEGTTTCSDKIDDIEQVCPNCRNYINDIIKALGKIDDQSFQTYQPYIARVVGSWFRDTFFIIPGEDDAATLQVYDDYDEYNTGDLTLDKLQLIENDEEFLKGTGELWTKYLLDEDSKDYAIFVINSDGTYLESEDDVENWKDKNPDLPEEIYTAIENPLNKEGIDYYGYIDPKTEVSDETKKEYFKQEDEKDDEDTNTNISDIERLFAILDISYIKRAKTIFADEINGSYIASDNVANGGWSAYSYDAETSDKKEKLDVDENSPRQIQKIQSAYNQHRDNIGEERADVFYYTLSAKSVVEQTEDGQRGMTNSKIKYLFKNKKYYRYDGTIETAFQIRDDWHDVLDLYKNTSGGIMSNLEAGFTTLARAAIKSIVGVPGSGFLLAIDELNKADETANQKLEMALNGYIDLIYYEGEISSWTDTFKFSRNFSGEKDDDGNLVADIASYEYQDLGIGDTTDDGLVITAKTKFTYDPRNPDLISKVDLTTESLTAFSILENTHTADADYAYRDLKELFVELDYFDTEDLTEPAKDILEWVLPESGSAGWPYRLYDKKQDVYGTYIHSEDMLNLMGDFYLVLDADDSETNSSDSEENSSDSTEENEVAKINNRSNKLYDEDEILKVASNKKVSNRANNRGDYNPPHMKSTFLETAEECWNIVVDKQPVYGQGRDGHANWEESGLYPNNIDCSSFVMWVLYSYGYDDYSSFANTSLLIATDLSAKYGFTEISVGNQEDVLSKLQPGDILVRNNQYGGHVQIIKEVDTTNHTTITYDCGGTSNWAESNRAGMQSDFYKSGYDGKIIRVEEGGFSNSATKETFKGFEKGAPVVSPATAKVLEIGKVTVRNETKEKILESFYVADDETIENNRGNGKQTSDESTESDDEAEQDNSSRNKTFVTQSQYDSIAELAQEKEDDEESPFGKSYKTGYVKLEIIGKESLAKFSAATSDISQYEDSLEAFYEDYYNEKQDKTICDSYTIYIEGIDLTGTMEEDEELPNIDNTIMGQLFTKNSESGSELLSSSTNIASNDSSDEAETDDTSESTDESSGEDFSIDNYKINYYTKKEIPTYYVEKVKEELEEREERKESMPSMIKLDNDLYLKAGTILGVAGDANIRIIMKDKDESVVENVEDYLEVEDASGNSKSNREKNVFGGEISASECGYRTEDDIIYAIENASKYPWSADMIDNVKEMMDGLLELQDTYDIDPLVAISLFRGESSCGLAYESQGQYRLDNHQHWDGDKCSYHQSQGFACYNSYNDNVVDWGNYIRNRFDDGSGKNIETWDDMAHFNGMTIYENCNVDDGGHAISFYNDLVETLKNKP